MNKEIYNKYYKNKAVNYEIVKCLKDKEVAIFGKSKFVRCIIASLVKYLESNLNRFDFYKDTNNLYYSLANYDWNKMYQDLGFKCFSFIPDTRKEQMNKFNLNANKYIKSYDLGLDFDNHNGYNYDQVYQDCSKIKHLFDKFGVSYSIKTSGSGFHIEVKADKLPKSIKAIPDIKERVRHIALMVADLRLILETYTLDVVGDQGEFFEPRRVFKVPYTADYKTGLIALPLTDKMFEDCACESVRNELCDPELVLKLDIINRGILERKGTSEGFDNLIKEVLG